VLGIEGESRPGLKKAADAFSLIKPGELSRALTFFKDQQVSEIVLLGKVRPDAVFRRENFDLGTWKRLKKVKEKSATALLETAFAYLKGQGLKVISPGPLLVRYFCSPGVLTRTRPSPTVLRDIDFGLGIARQAADLEIGQTLIVRDGTVVAVEGMEGTDRTIQRSGRLAGPGFVVVKAGRTSQDVKVDLPAVGLDTIKTLLRAGGAALGLEAGKVAFFQKQAAVRLADAQGASIVVRSME
jgi:DUF1009 family protein